MSQRKYARRATAVAAASALSALAFGVSTAGGASADTSKDVDVQLLAFNDYHGHLEADTPGTVLPDEPAGGSEYLSTHLAQLRKGHKNTLTVAAGDLIGGTPFLSGLFHDEPSVESLNAMGLDVSSVGNHEFDEGVTELLRMQNGGCHPVDGCYFPKDPYSGAEFGWLAANVTNDSTGETPLPPYWVKEFKGAKIGFIGMTLEGTDALVAQSGIAGWSFQDEVETANALVPELKAQGVEAIIVLLHEGGIQAGGFNDCVGISGPVVTIANNLDPEIDAMVTGHTHQPYNCEIDDPAGEPRRVTSAFSFGRIISDINLTIDHTTGDVDRDSVTAANHIVTQDVKADRTLTKIIEKWSAIADVIGNQPVGEITADITRAFGPPRPDGTRSEDRGSESDLGNMVADAQLWATQENGAQVAFMNPGGLRADLLYASSPVGEGDGVVTYAEAFNTQPFGNLLTTIPMSGQQIVDVLAEQCQPVGSSRPFLHLGVSEGLTYDLARTIEQVPDPDDPTATITACTDVSITNVVLDGAPLDLGTTYSVTVNNFLVDGGDNFGTFAEVDPALRVGAGIDLDALIAYLGTEGPIAPPGTDRVNELP